MAFLIKFLVFIFGSIVGSFLNSVSLRLGTGRLKDKKSICFSCGKELKWFELIPLLSFIIQKGKCRRCYSKISYQYPLSELITGLIFLGIFLKIKEFSFILLFWWVIFSILLIICFYDLRHKIIPSFFLFSFIFLSLLFNFLNSDFSFTNLLLLLKDGFIITLPFFLLWYFSKEKLFGLGDVFLILGIGFLVGLFKGFMVIFLASWIGSLAGLFLISFSKKFLKRSPDFAILKIAIPFAPFLILSLFIVFLFNLDFLSLIYVFVQ